MPLLIPLLAAAMFSAGARAEDYDDRFYFLPMGSYVLADGDRDTDDGLGATLAFGKRLSPQFELELRGSYLEYEADSPDRNAIGGLLCGLLPCAEPEDVEIKAIGAGASWFLSPEGRGLYLHGDAMAGDSTLLNAGLGYHFGSEAGWGLRLEALYHSDDGDYRETQFNLGLRIPIGSYAAPAEVVEPVQVVEPVEPPAPPPARCEMPSPGQPMTMDGCKAGDIIILRGVNFEFDKSTLTVNAKTLLDMVADALLARPDIKVEIDGHTDAKGSDEYNQKLSERRA
ncbi:MAG TPA: OmpA family protein, partial [Solimonas sp.]|nr:OmpA family protein [Solimonas sp.]